MPDRKAITAKERLALEAAPASGSQVLTASKAHRAESKAKTAYDTGESEADVEYEEESENDDSESPAQRRKQIECRPDDERMSNARILRDRSGGEITSRSTERRDRGNSARSTAKSQHAEQPFIRAVQKSKALDENSSVRRKQIEGVQVDDGTITGVLVARKRVTGEIVKRNQDARTKSSSTSTKSSLTKPQRDKSSRGPRKPKEITYEEAPSRLRLEYTGNKGSSKSDGDEIISSALVSRTVAAEGVLSNPKKEAKEVQSKAGPVTRRRRDTGPDMERDLPPTPDGSKRKPKAVQSLVIEAPKGRHERKALEGTPIVTEKKMKAGLRKLTEDIGSAVERPLSKLKPKAQLAQDRRREPKPEPVPEPEPPSDGEPEPAPQLQASADEGEGSDQSDDASEASINSATRRYNKEMDEYKTRMAQWDRDNEARRAALTIRTRSQSPEPKRRDRRQRSPSPDPGDRSLARRRRSESIDAEDRKLARRQRRDVQRSRGYEDDCWSEENITPRKQEVAKKEKKRVKKQTIKINLSNVNNVTL